MKKGFYENLLLFSKTAQTNSKNSHSLNQRGQDLPRKATTESLQHPFPFSTFPQAEQGCGREEAPSQFRDKLGLTSLK